VTFGMIILAPKIRRQDDAWHSIPLFKECSHRGPGGHLGPNNSLKYLILVQDNPKMITSFF